MAEDSGAEATVDAGEGDAGDAPPPSIADRLSWDVEAQGELPADLQNVSITDIGEYVESVRKDAAEAEQTRAREAQATATQREQDRLRANAEMQTDIDWATGVDSRLNSNDDDDRTAAQVDRAANEERYHRGLSQKYQQGVDSTRTKVLTEHYDTLLSGLGQAGHGDFANKLGELLPQHNNNTILAAIEYGRGVGKAEGVTEGRDAVERDGRIADGKEGAPQLSGRSGSGSQYGNRQWVEQQKSGDPDWLMKPSGETDNYGRPTLNGARVLQAMGANR